MPNIDNKKRQHIHSSNASAPRIHDKYLIRTGQKWMIKGHKSATRFSVSAIIRASMYAKDEFVCRFLNNTAATKLLPTIPAVQTGGEI